MDAQDRRLQEIGFLEAEHQDEGVPFWKKHNKFLTFCVIGVVVALIVVAISVGVFVATSENESKSKASSKCYDIQECDTCINTVGCAWCPSMGECGYSSNTLCGSQVCTSAHPTPVPSPSPAPIPVGQWCPAAPLQPEDRRSNKNTLTIAAYNAEFLFLNGSSCPSSAVNATCPWNSTTALLHMQAVANELKILNADIISFAELQDCYVLNVMNQQLGSLQYKPYVLKGTDSATGQNVGILTRIDPVVNLQRTTNRANYPTSGSQCGWNQTGNSGVSKHYYTTFNIAGLPKPLQLIGMHLIAYPTTPDRCSQREAQATVLSSLIAEALAANNSVITLGDLNDYDGLVLDISNSMPTSHVLNILRDPLPNQAGYELLSAANLTAQSDRYSYWYDQNRNCMVDNNELSAIDHILYSSDLADYVTGASFVHTYNATCSTLNSDHWPLVLSLATPTGKN